MVQNNAVAGGNFPYIFVHLDNIMARGPPWGYLPKATKSILVISAHNFTQAEKLFRGRSLEIFTESRYLGGYLRDSQHKAECLSIKVQDWDVGVPYNGGGGVQAPAGRIPRPAEVPPTVAGLHSAQNPGYGDGFHPVEKYL